MREGVFHLTTPPTLINQVCTILIVNCSVVSPTLNANPTLFIIPFNFLGRLEICNVAITVTYSVIFHPNFNHPCQRFIT